MPTQKQLERQERAEVRLSLASKRKPVEQLARLDLRLGDGVGAKKERARLSATLEKASWNRFLGEPERSLYETFFAFNFVNRDPGYIWDMLFIGRTRPIERV